MKNLSLISFKSVFFLMLSALISSLCAVSSEQAAGKEIVLIDSSVIIYEIVLASDADPATKHAAEELDFFLREIGQVKGKSAVTYAKTKIFVGSSEEFKKAFPELADVKLGKDEYIIKTNDSDLAILGKDGRSNLNGVYGFLDKYFGCRWFTKDVSKIPKREVVLLPQIDWHDKPDFSDMRVFYSAEAKEPNWAARNRMNQDWDEFDQAHGGPVSWPWPHYHSTHYFVPPEKYFDTHPEYFALIDGQRRKDGELCFSNPDVLRIIVDRIFELKEANPHYKIFTLCPMDHHLVCQCEKCRAINEREGLKNHPQGGNGGIVWWFTSELAGKVSEKYPDVKIVNAAYSYHIDPPKSPLHPNVVVLLCVPSLWEGCGIHKLEDCELMKDFVKLTADWANSCKDLWLWYYATEFTNYFMPNPNLYAIAKNYQYFIKNNVTGVMMQSSYSTYGGECTELRGWLCARLMWNAKQDTDTLIDEYLEGVYGKAAKPLKEYLLLWQSVADDPNFHMTMYASLNNFGGVEKGHLFNADRIKKADQLFNQAEQLAETPEVLERIKYFRLPLHYVKYYASQGFIDGVQAKFTITDAWEAKRLISKYNIEYHYEWAGLISQFLNNLDMLDAVFLDHWWELGPVQMPSENMDEVFSIAPPPFDTQKTFTGAKQNTVQWSKHQLEGKMLYLGNDKPSYPKRDYKYALAKIYSPKTVWTKLSISSMADRWKIWLNGNPVLDGQRERWWVFLHPDQYVIDICLKEGNNELLILMPSKAALGDWNAMVRVKDMEHTLKNDY